MEDLFKNAGGEFETPFIRIAEKSKSLKAYLFDWDGVFNGGIKGENINSPFSEADAMGINLLRFNYWLKTRDIPLISIITAENNPSAFSFAKREHLHSVYFSVKNKADALEHIYQTYGISFEHISYAYDDVMDLNAAEQCGIKFLVRTNASPAFRDYVKNKKLCDYITGNTGGANAVREICELILYSSGEYSNVITETKAQSFNYKEYLAMRDAIKPSFYTIESGTVIKKEIK